MPIATSKLEMHRHGLKERQELIEARHWRLWRLNKGGFVELLTNRKKLEEKAILTQPRNLSRRVQEQKVPFGKRECS